MRFQLFARRIWCLMVLPLILGACSTSTEPVTEKDARELASRITSTLESGNPGFVNKILDEEAFVDRMAREYKGNISGQEKKALRKGIAGRHFGNEILVSMNEGGTYRLLRRYSQDGKEHLLFRMLSGDGAVNYQDYMLVKREGVVKAADIFIYTSGDWLSTTLTDAMQMLGAELKHASDAETAAMSAKMKSAQAKIERSDFEGALRLIDELPASIQNKRIILQKKIQVLSMMGDDERYLSALDEMQRRFPTDKSLPLLMIDAHILGNQYEAALTDINRLDSMVGGDPMLNYQRALLYKVMEQPDRYLSTIERVYKYDPHFQPSAIEYISALLENGRKDRAQEVIAAYRKEARFDQSQVGALTNTNAR